LIGVSAPGFVDIAADATLDEDVEKMRLAMARSGAVSDPPAAVKP